MYVVCISIFIYIYIYVIRMYVSSVYSRCFISSLIPISRYDHHESVASSHSFISALVLSHSLALFYTSRSSCVLRVDYVCVSSVCAVYFTLLSVYFYFFFLHKISHIRRSYKTLPWNKCTLRCARGRPIAKKSVTSLRATDLDL